ncbi:hypothetical protein HMPREF1870_00760 [Bacteroidales bacterium KA00344]|nr:hypothetical protein HMPREF1870_00760 [Bacteroidales bacterium KA00344]
MESKRLGTSVTIGYLKMRQVDSLHRKTDSDETSLPARIILT